MHNTPCLDEANLWSSVMRCEFFSNEEYGPLGHFSHMFVVQVLQSCVEDDGARDYMIIPLAIRV